jgi:hypothetical protein
VDQRVPLKLLPDGLAPDSGRFAAASSLTNSAAAAVCSLSSLSYSVCNRMHSPQFMDDH